MISTTFAQFYEHSLREDITCDVALGADTQLYSNLSEPTSDTYAPGDARRPKVLGRRKKIMRRSMPETIFLGGSQKKTKK